MACGEYPDAPLNYWLEWRFIDGAVCPFGDQIGVAVTMLLFFGITFMSLYLASDSVIVPVAVLIVLAPATVALLPALGFNFVVVVLILAIASAGTYLYIQSG